jgi:UrcA family protein
MEELIMKTRINRFPVITLTLTSLLGLGAAAVAGSAPAAEAPTVTVSYKDLNMSRPTDVHTLYQRLERAAASVCSAQLTEELARRQAYTRCYESALESAVLEVRSPELLALDKAAHGGRES